METLKESGRSPEIASVWRSRKRHAIAELHVFDLHFAPRLTLAKLNEKQF